MKLGGSNTHIIQRLLIGSNNRPLRSILSRLEPADMAALFNNFNEMESKLLLKALFSIGKANEALLELPEKKAAHLILKMDKELLLKLFVYSTPEDGADFIEIIKNERQGTQKFIDEILNQLENPHRNKIKQILNYPENSAGRIMSSQAFTLDSDLSVTEALEALRSKIQTEFIYYVYCVKVSKDKRDPKNKLIGVTSLRKLAISSPETLIRDITKKELVFVNPESSSEEVAQLVSQYDLVAIPVVDKERNFLGVITIDDVLDIVQDQTTAKIYAQAGLQKDDLVFTPSFQKFKNRMPWMLLNLALAVLASAVVSLFEDTMRELIILASLKNIVSGLSGSTAIQTLTVVTRGLAKGDFKFISYIKSIVKEVLAGLSIGLCIGLCAGLLTYVWKENLMVSVIICISMIINSIVAASFGATVPIILKKLNKDPAIGSGVLVTMITDIFSFLSFLGISALSLKYFA